jgi:hypothetical protein
MKAEEDSDIAVAQTATVRLNRNLDVILQAMMVIMLLLAGVIKLLGWAVIWSTVTGMLIAAAGGIVNGLTAHHYLASSRSTRDTFLGMALTVGIGVLTIGYLYIFHIQGPMKSIGTFSRTIKQFFIFLEFLLAQISGIRLDKQITH